MRAGTAVGGFSCLWPQYLQEPSMGGVILKTHTRLFRVCSTTLLKVLTDILLLSLGDCILY